jgi:hypothetical protein
MHTCAPGRWRAVSEEIGEFCKEGRAVREERRSGKSSHLEVEAFEEGVDAARDVGVAPVRGPNVRAPRHQLHTIIELGTTA